MRNDAISRMHTPHDIPERFSVEETQQLEDMFLHDAEMVISLLYSCKQQGNWNPVSRKRLEGDPKYLVKTGLAVETARGIVPTALLLEQIYRIHNPRETAEHAQISILGYRIDDERKRVWKRVDSFPKDNVNVLYVDFLGSVSVALKTAPQDLIIAPRRMRTTSKRQLEKIAAEQGHTEKIFYVGKAEPSEDRATRAGDFLNQIYDRILIPR